MQIINNNLNAANKDNYIEPYPRQLFCAKCGSELAYDESDLRMGAYGCVYIDCPVCKYDNMLEDNEHSIILTAKNIEFPTHFHHISVKTGAKDICNTEAIRKEFKKAIDYFRRNKEAEHWDNWSGNLFIMVDKYSEDESYEIIISKDFYNMAIPFEKKDYE